MILVKNKWILGILLGLMVFHLPVSAVFAENEEMAPKTLEMESGEEMEDPFEGKPPLADQLREFSNEIARRMHHELQEMLDQELRVLREESRKNSYTAEERIAKQEGLIRDNPQNAEAHFALGEAYDDIRDGANAIIHTQIAEHLFKEQKNVKGVAESRRNLRLFLDKYRFKEEDFLLN